MSDHTAHDAAETHEGPIKTPKQLILTVLFAFIVPIAVIVLLVSYVGLTQKEGSGTDSMSPAAVAQRIQPIGTIEIKDVSDPTTMKTGEQVFQAQCTTCHATGAVGAPKLGDEAAWSARIGQGMPALLNSALKGKGNMPPQGGGDFSDLEIARAVVYMANKGGAKFEEPKAPAAAASGAAPAASETKQ